MSEILTRRIAPIDKEARPLDQLNVIAKVAFGGELFLRGENDKRGYKGPLFEALPNDLIISKIRVGQGSFYVIGSDLNHVAVSPEYPVYTPDCDRVNPAYLALVLRTPDFLAQLVASASGNTTKRRIRPEFFESRDIPLPPLNRQRTIVAAHRAGMNRAAELEREADETETQAMMAFETALGFAPPPPLPDCPVFIASFKDLDRWSHEGVLRRTVEGATANSLLYPAVQLRDVIADLVVGWSPRCLDRPAEKNEWGVLKLSAVTSGRLKPAENKALPSGVDRRPELEVRRGDVLITRGSGVTRLVGATTFVADKPPGKLMICDLIFRVAFREASEIDPAFLAATLATSDLRSQIEGRRTGAAPMMQKITKSALMALRLPLPSKNEQVLMTTTLAESRAKAANVREKARKARADAWKDFEAVIYATEDDNPGAGH